MLCQAAPQSATSSEELSPMRFLRTPSLRASAVAVLALLGAQSLVACETLGIAAAVGTAAVYPLALSPRAPGISISSAPPGARVLIDGKDTGFVTPCDLGVPREKLEIQLVLDGYQPAVRRVVPDEKHYLVTWEEAAVNPNTWNFPLWLNYEDGLVPYRYERGYSPMRIFVRMKLAGS
jgi:PEGA domain-containing protein